MLEREKAWLFNDRVVDDVQEQRELAVSMLTRLGYEAAAVSSSEEALHCLKTNRANLIVLDMIMDPGMDGLETYRRILDSIPGQKAVIVSSFSVTQMVFLPARGESVRLRG